MPDDPPLTPEGLSADSRRLWVELQNETDRGAALVAAAFLDDVLKAMLLKHFIDEPAKARRLLRHDGPVGTFWARTELAYCLGLIGPEMYEDLDRIRDIRNEFSHSSRPASFEDDSPKALCAALHAFRKVMPEEYGRMSSREQFVQSAVSLTNHVLLRALGLSHAKVGEDFKVIRASGEDAKGG